MPHAVGTQQGLAQLIEFAITTADAKYAATLNESVCETLVHIWVDGGIPCPYNMSAASARAETLGQALLQSAIPVATQRQSLADAFTQSFFSQPYIPLEYGWSLRFTIADGSLIAAIAANQSQAFGPMLAQVWKAVTSCFLVAASSNLNCLCCY